MNDTVEVNDVSWAAALLYVFSWDSLLKCSINEQGRAIITISCPSVDADLYRKDYDSRKAWLSQV